MSIASRDIDIHFLGQSVIKHRKNISFSRAHWRLYWNSEPGHLIIHNDRTYELDEHHVCVMPPHTPTFQTMKQPAQSFYIHASLGMPYDLFSGQVFMAPMDETLRLQGEELVKQLRDCDVRILKVKRKGIPSAAFELRVMAFLFGVMCKIPEDVWPAPPRDARIRRCLDVIENDVTNPPSNDDLAATAAMSTNAFIRLFGREVGCPPQTYVMGRRLAKAANQLLHSDRSVEEIAEANGFCDRSYFSKMFKRRYEMGPATYRKRQD